MDLSWSDGIYPSDVPRDFEEVRNREERKERISLYWESMVNDQEPRVHKNALLHLMQDLKDEGNDLFKEGDFDNSWMHYRNALFIARILEVRFYHIVDKEFISTLFSNRAFCCLKKEMYVEAVQDCESAIQIFPGNIKAYYRQVLALKAQKRLSDALKVAEKGMETKPGVFKEILEELKELIAEEKNPTSVSAKDAKPVEVRELDNEWLQGTNINVTKQAEPKQKMPSKKNKGKSNTKQAKVNGNSNKNIKSAEKPSREIGNGAVESEEGESDDTEGTDDRLSEDENFVNNFMSVRNTKLGVTGQNFHVKFPPSVDVSEPANKPQSMGLDCFSPPAGKAPVKPDFVPNTPSISSSVSSLSSRASTPNYRALSQSAAEEIKKLKFPLDDYYDWKLACRQCFVKVGEGVKGFRYHTSLSHECVKDVMLVREKKEGKTWIKVRPRPESKFQQFGSYKLCNHFSSGHPCSVGEEKCTFAHNIAERKLWDMDRIQSFVLLDFIGKIQQYKIDTSEELFKLQSADSGAGKRSDPTIPGLNYKTKQAKAPPSVPVDQVPTPVKQPLLPTPPRAHLSPNSLPAAPIMNRPRMPGPPIQGFPDPYKYMMPPPPPPHGMGPMPPHGMPFPPHMMKNRFPVQGLPPRMMPPFSSPTSQAQIRPNMMRAPAPKPVADSMPYDDSSDSTTSNTQEFPLSHTHDYKLVCKICYRVDDASGMYVYQPGQHKCEENILIVRPKHVAGQWLKIRERKNHRVFTGSYIWCNSIRIGGTCRYGEDSCSFAHNEWEQLLWTMEKDDEFNITEFIIQSRSKNLDKGYSIADILQRHSGYLSFVCKACFYNTPQMINREGAEGKCSGKAKHDWEAYKILAHFSSDGSVTIINPRGFLHKTAFFKICKWLHYCRNRINAECRFAHSMVERDLWMFERDTGYSQDKIVELSNKQLGISTSAQETKTYTSEITPSATLFQSPTMQTPVPAMKSVSQTQDTKPVASVDEYEDDLCPYIIQELCLTCWKNGKKSIQDGSKDRCVKNHSNWKTNQVYLVSPSNKEIRVLPRKIPSGFRFILCSYIEKRGKCGYTGGGPCQFAHSQEELEIWQWMCAHDIRKLEDLYRASKEAQVTRAAQVKNKAISGESVVSVAKRVALPTQVKFSMYYCSYCGKQCNSEKQWDEHCASEKHNFNVNSDREHQWNYRQPPWGMPGTSYEICYKHKESRKCPYSNVPDMYNMCQYAHSEEELDEWRERYEWRQMKRDMARQEKVFSFMDELLEEYQSAEHGIRVIAEDIPNVVVTCEQELTIYEEEKNAVFTWIFNVESAGPLEKVALLYNKDRLHFSLKESEMDKNAQIAPGVSFQINRGYQVEVQFTGNMFGSFNQWVIFDFGTRPVLVRKLYVEVGTYGTHEKVKSLREKLQFDRWTAENREIVRYERANVDELERKLTSKYKSPSSSESVISQHSVTTELNWNNYHHKMHQLLEMEEMKRHQIISSYNLCKTVTIQESIQEHVLLMSQNGELFAKVPLAEYLTEDTDAGKLILTSVRSVLLAPQSHSNRCVYEAVIVRKDNFGYDGRGKEYMYLCLSQKCVQGLNLRSGMTLQVEIQFQMDRMWFCMMHYAVDHLSSTDVVFPDVSKIKPFHEKATFRITSSVLNPDQMTAIQHIVTERVGYNPPFVIYGPFGTGKTESIAQAVMVLIREKPDAKILICAQSNSAADLYLTKHLDPFLRKASYNAKIRRVYFKERRVNTVQPEVKKYCQLSPNKDEFEFPTYDDIKKHNIVIVTMSTSLLLSELGLHDYFTHIFVDEAAQTLEAEAIMPLTLASEKTCIVLAGDHQQISPKVYSPEARDQKFDMSLLERLFQYYDSFSHKIDPAKPLNILLRINYRTKMEILRFISAIFYGGPDKLESRANIPSVLEITPLMFYAVQGVEIQDKDSISFYNMSEVQEVVERVQELYLNWPAEWGEKNAKAIGVVTPYFDQVQLIRKALRKKHPDLKNITVERVNNVQGKEFRALFISTVRTRGLIDSQYKPEGECEGDGGYYGFLSDRKLLNTALTRAQSYVAVVGDPVALCAIGACLSVWRTYLKHCQNMKSIQPSTLTLESIKQQVSNLAQSPARQRMAEISGQNKPQGQVTPQERTPASMEQTPGPQSLSGASNGQLMPAPLAHPSVRNEAWKPTSKEALLSNLIPSHEVKPLVKSISQLNEISSRPIPHQKPEKIAYSYDWSECYDTATDDLLKQMAEEAIRMERVLKQRDKTKVPEGPVYVEFIDFNESNGHVKMFYNDSSQSVRKGDFKEIQLYDETQLQAMIQKYPERFKRCIFSKDQDRMRAEVIEQRPHHRPVEVGNVRDSGTAMDGDEVVVEILPSQDVDELDLDNMDTSLHGRVVGILNRKIDPEYKCFVCRVDPDNTGIMIPINTGAHKMYALSTGGEECSNEVSVYQISKEGQVTQSQVVKINPVNCQETLFVVRFLKWHSNLYFPLGITVGVIPAGTTPQSALSILNLEYDIKRGVSKAVEQEVETHFPSNYTIPVQEYDKRLNLREKWTFSISPSDAEIGQALSIEETVEGNYYIGVHVSDVTYFVKMNSNIDTEARNKTESITLPNSEKIHMLPEKLGTDLCSLKPDVDRLTLSVFLTVSKSGEILRAEPKRCVINSKKKFTFEDVADVLVDPNAASDYLKSCIIVLFHMSRVWRRQRLGNASLYRDVDVTQEDKHSPEAYIMLQELMIHTNHQVAMFMIQHFPTMVPLYCQGQPNETELEKWRQEHAADAINSIALTKPFLEGHRTCQCKMACTCIINYIKRTSNIKVHDSFDVGQALWQAMCEAAEMGNMSFVQNIIIAAESHPQLIVALMKLEAIQNRSEYVCCEESPDGRHYSLNLIPYVHFVNPISRYMDLVTHRMVVSALEKSPLGYNQSDIKQLCSYLTNASDIARQYRRAVQSIHLSLTLKCKPVSMSPSIERINEDEIVLCFPPTFGNVPSSKRRIKLSLLALKEPPKLLDAREKGLQLSWRERVYDLVAPPGGMDANKEEEVNPNQHIYQIPSFHWQKLLMAIRDENQDKLRTTVLSVKDQVKNPALNKNYATEITTERLVDGEMLPYTDFTVKFSSSALLAVQVTAEPLHGLLMPSIQLLNLTPNFDVCLEHRANSRLCFAREPVSCASKESYTHETDYVDSWLSVLNIEAAQTAVEESNSVLIRNVSLLWKSEGTNEKLFTAQFCLPLEFCKKRNIKFSSDAMIDNLFDPENVHFAESYFLDFICVRYSRVQITGHKEQDRASDQMVGGDMATKWVGHCVVTAVTRNEKELKVKLQLHHSSVEQPSFLQSPQINKTPCTIEWIQKTMEARQMECAIRTVPDSGQLAKDIALGRTPVPSVDYRDVEILRQFPAPGLPLLDPAQDQAISTAMKQPFTVISGPPGTGKSLMAARLIYMLSLRNKMVPVSGIKPQILVCAPNDQSLDILVDYLSCLGQSCPKILRVYDEKTEQQEFPRPAQLTPCQWTVNNAHNTPIVQEKFALHHKIRNQETTFGPSISQFDMLFRLYPDDITEQQTEEYEAIIKKAEMMELGEAEVLVCTCTASAKSQIRKSCNVTQIVIDNCGMVSEPECMIPIATFDSVKQVVVLGDVQQVPCKIRSPVARSLGLGNSLLDRYRNTTVGLRTQYRMQQAIADLASLAVSGEMLTCGTENQKQILTLFTKDKPVTFCRFYGKEESTGQEIVNQEESSLAVAVASKLVNRHHLTEESIVILSFYQGQCSMISKKLQQKGHKNIAVCTVESCQGREWDNVILSTVRTIPGHTVELRSTHEWKETHLGHLMNPGLVSQALTRAKKRLIILGNNNLLRCDALWEKYLQLCESKGQVLDGRQYLKWLN